MKRMHMKNTIAKQSAVGRHPRLLLWMLIISLSFIGSGCLPPPPRLAPKPPTPPGGPNAGAVKAGAANTGALKGVSSAATGDIFLNLQG
jgi:hypothetical protein